MLLFTGKCINSGILNIGVAQDIGQMHDILLHPVISNREQMAQIMRKNFFRADPLCTMPSFLPIHYNG